MIRPGSSSVFPCGGCRISAYSSSDAWCFASELPGRAQEKNSKAPGGGLTVSPTSLSPEPRTNSYLGSAPVSKATIFNGGLPKRNSAEETHELCIKKAGRTTAAMIATPHYVGASGLHKIIVNRLLGEAVVKLFGQEVRV